MKRVALIVLAVLALTAAATPTIEELAQRLTALEARVTALDGGPLPSPSPTGAPSPSTSQSPSITVGPSPITDPDRAVLPGPVPSGPGGGVFSVHCDYSHRADDDPIVNPGTASAHTHEFFGSELVTRDTTKASQLRGGPTTCELLADTAGYWSPALRAPNGSLVAPQKVLAYYRALGGPVRAYPAGLKLVAGYATGQTPTVNDRFGWSCGETRPYHPSPQNCASKNVLHIVFPNCWDGVNLDSPNHRSHMAYASNGCPASHPVKVLKLSMHVQYHSVADGRGYELVSTAHGQGPHADFFNAWLQDKFEELTATCANANRSCLKVGG